MLHGPSRFERGQNRVGIHGCTLENLVPQAHPRARSRWRHTRRQPAARLRRGRPPASPDREYPAPSTACPPGHPGWLAVCSGRTASKPSRRSADRTPTSGRSHVRCRASNGRAFGRPAHGDESPSRHRRRQGSPQCSTCRFRHRLQSRRSWQRRKTSCRRVGSCPWPLPPGPGPPTLPSKPSSICGHRQVLRGRHRLPPS